MAVESDSNNDSQSEDDGDKENALLDRSKALKIAVTSPTFSPELHRSPAISKIYRNLAHPRNRKERIKFIKSEALLHVSAINPREPIMRFCEAITAGASGSGSMC
jgi:hypothetical protein